VILAKLLRQRRRSNNILSGEVEKNRRGEKVVKKRLRILLRKEK